MKEINNCDFGYEFETWLRYVAPGDFKASTSKKVAMGIVFSRIADCVRPLVDKAPHEFQTFFEEMKKRSQKIGKWKAPRGHRCIVAPEDQCYPSGEPRAQLVKTT